MSPIALLALVGAFLPATPSIPEPHAAPSPAAFDELPGIRLGGTVTLTNETPDVWIITPTIDGVPGDVVVINPGDSHTWTIPNDASLVGKIFRAGPVEFRIVAP